MNSLAEMIVSREFRWTGRREVRAFLMERHGRTVREAGAAIREFERRYVDKIKAIGGGYVWTGRRWILIDD